MMSWRGAALSGKEEGLFSAADEAMHGDVGRDMGDDAPASGLPQSSAMLSAPSPRRSLSSHLGSCNVRMSNDCAYVGLNI